MNKNERIERIFIEPQGASGSRKAALEVDENPQL
jgi:hypothetical protein